MATAHQPRRPRSRQIADGSDVLRRARLPRAGARCVCGRDRPRRDDATAL